MKVFIPVMVFILFVGFNNFEPSQIIACEIDMTKSELLDAKLIFNCDDYKNQTIKSFKIKIPNKPTVMVYGDSLQNVTRSHVKNLKKGNIITFYDIETQSETNTKDKVSVVVTISD